MGMYAAVDIGGTKTLVAVFDADGTVLEKTKFPTDHDYTAFLDDLAASIKTMKTKGFKAVCAAVPAKLDRERGIAVAFGNLEWANIPISDDIKKIFNAPVIIENDAKLAALSEALRIKDEFRKVLYVTISTGIGGGLIIDGKIDPDFDDMEVGQILLEYEGRLQDWEDFGSGRAFQKKFGKRVSDTDENDNAAWYWLARNIAVGLIDLIATLNPEVIVLGGGAGAHLDKYRNRLEEQLKIYENPMFTIPPIRKAQYAEEAVLYGCFELAKADHETIA
jgi:predicted NBD/HSP70 family sugar kinase